jgi:hypothetical protein
MCGITVVLMQGGLEKLGWVIEFSQCINRDWQRVSKTNLIYDLIFLQKTTLVAREYHTNMTLLPY